MGGSGSEEERESGGHSRDGCATRGGRKKLKQQKRVERRGRRGSPHLSTLRVDILSQGRGRVRP